MLVAVLHVSKLIKSKGTHSVATVMNMLWIPVHLYEFEGELNLFFPINHGIEYIYIVLFKLIYSIKNIFDDKQFISKVHLIEV